MEQVGAATQLRFRADRHEQAPTQFQWEPSMNDIYSPFSDNTDDGDIFVGLKWALIATLLSVMAIATGLWAGS
jgi:hypothetical protein